MKNMKRSVRRSHYVRLKAKWKKIRRNDWYHQSFKLDEEWLDIAGARLSRTQTTCSSCLCHINPRKNNELTLPERRNMLTYSEYINDI
jgi:hypothetical protein